MSGTGRAALFFGPRQAMRIEEFPVPDPEPGAIVVRVARANVCGSDLHIWRGDGLAGAMARAEGRIIGHEMTGTVHAMGPRVEADWAGQPLAPGDRVVYQYFAPCQRCRACLRGLPAACPNSFAVLRGRPSDPPHFRGAFADYFYVTPRMAVFKVPDHVTDAMVAGVNCALAEVVYGLERVAAGFGDTVVIQGAGGLGIYATAVAKQRGAHRVIVVDGFDDRLELAAAMGADELVDLRVFATPEERANRVKDLTGGGADVVCELVGVSGAVAEGLQMLGRGGRLLEIGTVYPGTQVELDPFSMVMKNQSMIAVASYDAASLRRAVDFLERNVGRLPLDQVLVDYPLEAINEAFADQDAGKVTRASIVMTTPSGP